MPSKSRNWVFTRQLTDAEVAHLGVGTTAAAAPVDEPFNWFTSVTTIRYIVYQVEVSPTTGKYHCQGTVCFKDSRSMHYVKTLIGNEPHCENCKDVRASIEYCKKAETRFMGPWEHGEAPKAFGAKKTNADLLEDVKTGKRYLQILEEDPNTAGRDKAMKFMRFCVTEKLSDRQKSGIKVLVFYGGTDLGKTYTAVNVYGGEDDYYILDPPANGQPIWFDGYEGQKTLIIDDFSSKVCNLEQLKRLLDVYKCKLPVKGGYCWASWSKVVITSNYPPRQWYVDSQGGMAIDIGPLKRRIHEIRHFVARGIYFPEDFEGNTLGDSVDMNAADHAAIVTTTTTTAPSPLPYLGFDSEQHAPIDGPTGQPAPTEPYTQGFIPTQDVQATQADPTLQGLADLLDYNFDAQDLFYDQC